NCKAYAKKSIQYIPTLEWAWKSYCGLLYSFITNFFEHECFKHYVEDKDRIYVDENYVVTIRNTKTAEGSVCTDTLDELLIGAVKARKGLYDYRIPANERTNLRKNALWAEVSNTLGGAFNPEEAKAR
ncbi:histone H3, partial [Lasius niger]